MNIYNVEHIHNDTKCKSFVLAYSANDCRKRIKGKVISVEEVREAVAGAMLTYACDFDLSMQDVG